MLNAPEMCQAAGRDRRWLNYATALAGRSTHRWRMACVLIRGGRVIAVGNNRLRNIPGTAGVPLSQCGTHAEIAALRAAGGNVSGATAYVARVGRDGKARHAQPCRRCADALEEAGVRAVWTSDEEYLRLRALGTN